MAKTISGKQLVADLLSDPNVRAEYDKLKPVMELAWTLVEARNQAKLTQAELAERMGTTQSVIARIESGRSSPTFETVRRYFEATGHEFRVQVLPVSKGRRRQVSKVKDLAA